MMRCGCSKGDSIMGKKALLVVSFGTSYGTALAAIENIEQTLSRAFPGYDLYRAFTSGIIIRKMKKQGVEILNPGQVMDLLAEQGYQEVLCQPTHIISGLEYHKLLGILKEYRERIPEIRIGDPLLTEEEDYLETADIVMSEIPRQLKSDEALILMGHGTVHESDNIYTRFEHVLRDVGYGNVFVGTVEGFLNVDYLIRRLKRRAFRKIYAMPLMIVAGDHARNDLAGEETNSWNSKLGRAGYQTELIIKGLGEIDALADIYVKHAGKARDINELPNE